MIDPYTTGWLDECWGRIVIAIGKGEGKNELGIILDEAAQDRWEAGMRDEKVRRTREIANKLLGNKISCSKCGNVFDRPVWENPGNDYTCVACEPMPF